MRTERLRALAQIAQDLPAMPATRTGDGVLTATE